MNILYVCHRFPFPPKRGGKIRPFNMIRHLARSHDVTVCSLVRSDAEAREGEGLAAHCKRYEMVRVHDPVQALRMVVRLPTPVPSSFGFFHSSELARRIRAVAARERFDLIFVHCSSVARYVEDVRDVPKMLDFGDMDSQKWREYALSRRFPLSLGYGLEGWKLEREEARLAGCFDLCTATTRAEWQTLRDLAPSAATDWFPNGVDSDYFAPSDGRYKPEHIVFVGRMDYYPNQEGVTRFCNEVLPAIRAKRPAVRLHVVGADPSPAIMKLGQQPGITVTGSVPDVRPYLREAALMIAPLNIARGTQNKILEGMAAGVPVVASRVAAGGVDAHSPDHLLVAVSTEEWVVAVERILANPVERERLATAGRARVLSHHAWPQSMRRLDGIIERCLAQARPSRALATI
jgi:sugar transferase (PEP-CTERM/EpsH1 system associated)